MTENNRICGFSSPGEENREAPLNLNDLLIKHKSTSFFMRACGLAMYPSVKPGDILLVDRSLGTRNGDLVVAETDGDFTVRYFSKQSGHWKLQSENKNFEDIEGSDSVHIFGVITAVIRTLR